eukprot:TRINITY_DN769_c0_g8_i1.p1 TRINITY_DN769_c0_g8~~TRINITY_DN769_c0_g8_i1.p1  ORF type:complete len:502 (+),score=110.94 TRINITY_DN769_c0_g8_i1:321-1826(+)
MRDVYKFKLVTSGDCDLCWMDTGVTPEVVAKLKAYQKINHFPNTSCITRKNKLGKNLTRMRKMFKKDYNFFPLTWTLPGEWGELKAELSQGKSRTYIVKPESMSQGKGIFLTKTFDRIDQGARYVVQRYVRKPYLIEGLKFDLRIYVLVYGCDPLRVYLFKEGLARFSTNEYARPSRDNMQNLYMHLTNYAINKTNANFVFNSDANNPTIGHKRSLSFVWNYIDAHGGNSKSIQRKIKRAIVKTLCAVQPQLVRCFRSCQPTHFENSMCFEILGFDILLDHRLKPWLLEVNHSPSFHADTPFDQKVKTELIADTIKLLRLDPAHRIIHAEKEQARLNARAYTRTIQDKITREEREEAKESSMAERDKYEQKNGGGFTRIYPDERANAKYQSFIAHAQSELDRFYGLRKEYFAQLRLAQKTSSRASSKSFVARDGRRRGSKLQSEDGARMSKVLEIYGGRKEPRCVLKDVGNRGSSIAGSGKSLVKSALKAKIFSRYSESGQ